MYIHIIEEGSHTWIMHLFSNCLYLYFIAVKVIFQIVTIIWCKSRGATLQHTWIPSLRPNTLYIASARFLMLENILIIAFICISSCFQIISTFAVHYAIKNGAKLQYTVCSRSLDLFNIVRYHMKWVKASWTFSNGSMQKNAVVLNK